MKGSSDSVDFQAFHTGKIVMTLMNKICFVKLMCGALSISPVFSVHHKEVDISRETGAASWTAFISTFLT